MMIYYIIFPFFIVDLWLIWPSRRKQWIEPVQKHGQEKISFETNGFPQQGGCPKAWGDWTHLTMKNIGMSI